MTSENLADVLAEFDRVARKVTDPAYQEALERRVYACLAAQNRRHKDMLAKPADRNKRRR